MSPRRGQPAAIPYPTRRFADLLRAACIEAYGSVAEAARVKSVPPPNLYRWASGGSLPESRSDYRICAAIVKDANLDPEMLAEHEFQDRLAQLAREWSWSDDQLVASAEALREWRTVSQNTEKMATV